MRKGLIILPRIHITAGMLLNLILLACFLAVSFSIKSYGASYDEPLIYKYAENNFQIYFNRMADKPYEGLIRYYDLHYYGPAYWLTGDIAVGMVGKLFPTLDIFDAWHLVNFACFLLGGRLLFNLGRRFVSEQAALIGSLLYLSQPLLWGHGVINPKDIPFMTFFLASIVAGVKMTEMASAPVQTRARRIRFFQGWRKFFTSLFLLVAVLALIDRVFGNFISLPAITNLISQGYNPNSNSIFHTLFARIANHASAIPMADYIDKAMQIVNIAEFAVIFLVAGAALAVWIAQSNPAYRWILLAGILGGMTISIRVLGPAALGLVILFMLVKLRRRSIGPILAYLAIALIATYIFWPYLWNAPIAHFWESLKVNASFPWNGLVRFEGNDYPAANLPWYYLPKLIAIQLTLPLLVLAAAGLGGLIHAALRRRLDWGLASIPALWFLVPFIAVMVVRPTMYDNFRQLLFILPPLFIFAGLAVDTLLRRIRPGLIRGIVLLAILLPGVMAGIWLHPYEYTYYNALVGWTGQVDRLYENDYWYTSMCEAGQIASKTISEGAKIAITDRVAMNLFQRCTSRKFVLSVEKAGNTPFDPGYAFIPTRYNDDLTYFSKMQPILTLGRGNTPFSVIKQKP